MSNWTADDLFRWWIVQQQSAVMVHLGKITHPVTGKIERDLETARLLIDLLGMMETKTKGNLSGDEERFLTGVLTNLRLNFVQEANRPEPPDTGAAGEADDATGGGAATGEAAAGDSAQEADGGSARTAADPAAADPAAGDSAAGSSAAGNSVAAGAGEPDA